MKKPARLTGRGTQASSFYQLCGSPIRVNMQPTYEEDTDFTDAAAAPVTPLTPPLSRRPQTQSPNSPAAKTRWGDQDDEEETEDEDNEELNRTGGDDNQEDTARTPPLSLAEAKEAGIPCFAMERSDSKTDLPDSAMPPLPAHTVITMDELVMMRLLGEGAFGRVYQAKWCGKQVAVKVLIHQNLTESAARDFEKEVTIMSFLQHPNICRLLGANLEPPHRSLVVELAERGCLWSVLRLNRRQLTTDIRARMVLEIARGMHYLHGFEPPILHRDMKSPNLLVNKNFSIKITDFGLARVKAQIRTMTGNCGTVQWMAPEVLGSRKYTEKADVFSFGIVMWELFTGRCPYDGMTQIQAGLSVLNHDLRPSIPSSCPRFFARLIRMCWARDPELRPSFEQIVRMYEDFFFSD